MSILAKNLANVGVMFKTAKILLKGTWGGLIRFFVFLFIFWVLVQLGSH